MYWSLNSFKSEPVVNVKFQRIFLLCVMDMKEINDEKNTAAPKNRLNYVTIYTTSAQ